MRLPLLFFSMLCAGCASNPPPPGISVPASLLFIEPAPIIPDPDTATDKDVALYLIDLHTAYQVAVGKLTTLRKLLAPEAPL